MSRGDELDDDDLFSDFELRALSDDVRARPTDAEDTNAKASSIYNAKAEQIAAPSPAMMFDAKAFVMPPASAGTFAPAAAKEASAPYTTPQTGPAMPLPQTGPANGKAANTGPAFSPPANTGPSVPFASTSQNPVQAAAAVRDLAAVLRSIPQGVAPRIARLPPRMQQRGLCAVVLVWSDGRKDVLR